MLTSNNPLSNLEGKKVLLAFGAKWCGPYTLLLPTLKEIEESGVEVRYVDVDEHGAASDRYAVVSLPTFVVLNDTKEMRRRIGSLSRNELKELASKAL